jgi:hypothetical protein
LVTGVAVTAAALDSATPRQAVKPQPQFTAVHGFTCGPPSFFVQVFLVVDNPISAPGSLSETAFKLRYHTAFAPLVACHSAAFNLATFTLDEHSRRG